MQLRFVPQLLHTDQYMDSKCFVRVGFNNRDSRERVLFSGCLRDHRAHATSISLSLCQRLTPAQI